MGEEEGEQVKIETLIANLEDAIKKDYVDGAVAESDYRELNHLLNDYTRLFNDYTRQRQLVFKAQKALVDYVRAKAKKKKSRNEKPSDVEGFSLSLLIEGYL